MIVELIYDLACPNVDATRENLLKAFAKTALTAKWQEWDRNAPDSPNYVQQYGSPTLLINGQDIVGEKPTSNNCCRIYQDDQTGKLTPIPTIATISKKLNEANTKSKTKKQLFSLKSLVATLPSIFIALLPKLTCPLCWPAYAGLLSTFGISFTNYTPYLLPLMIGFLLIALFTLYYKATSRRGYYPLYLGIVAAIIIVLGKFVLHLNAILYLGILILLLASIWNSFPKKKTNCCRQ